MTVHSVTLRYCDWLFPEASCINASDHSCSSLAVESDCWPSSFSTDECRTLYESEFNLCLLICMGTFPTSLKCSHSAYWRLSLTNNNWDIWATSPVASKDHYPDHPKRVRMSPSAAFYYVMGGLQLLKIPTRRYQWASLPSNQLNASTQSAPCSANLLWPKMCMNELVQIKNDPTLPFSGWHFHDLLWVRFFATLKVTVRPQASVDFNCRFITVYY